MLTLRRRLTASRPKGAQLQGKPYMKSQRSTRQMADKTQKCNHQPSTINQKGFSLLELLVVISIIVILITIGLTSFTTAQKKGRDAKRKSDIKEVQTALEQYYSVCSFGYPTPAGSTFYTSIICTSPSVAVMPTVPSDPRSTPYYCGPTPAASNCTSSSYTICAMLESEPTPVFCLTNQQ
jgi:general secretion pathway protein G